MNKNISISPSRIASVLLLAFSVGLILPMVACSFEQEKPRHTKVIKHPRKQKQYNSEPDTPAQVLVRKFSKYLP